MLSLVGTDGKDSVDQRSRRQRSRNASTAVSPILSISLRICQLHASSVREKAKWLSYSTTTMVRAGSTLNERETEAEFA
jgi:hypothetical protein